MYKNVTGVSKINPILEKYFYIDSLVANNLRFQLTGFETNHPDKSKFTKMWNNIACGLNINNPLIANMKQIEAMQNSKVWLVADGTEGTYSDKVVTSNPEVAEGLGNYVDLRPYGLSFNDLKALNELDLYELNKSTNK